MQVKRKLRMGMIGGGRGAFIGSVHRMAGCLDGQVELVCGAFSRDAEKSRLSGEDLYLPAERVYGSYEEMLAKEKRRAEGERMDFVVIVTPNVMHYPAAAAALESGFHVMCDKPMTFDLAEAKRLEALVKKTGLLFGLTHNYTGYPMVKEARAMVAAGKLGKVRKIVVEYLQGWLSSDLERTGQKQAAWRTDPKQTGISCCMGDIGTHAENLAEYVTGLKMEEVCADFATFGAGRRLEDDGSVLVRFEKEARGLLYASQVAAGEENGLHIRVYGEKGGLEWRQMEPNTLWVKWADRATEVVRPGVGALSEAASRNCRLPAGHPEGFIEAFANLYRNFAGALRCRLAGAEVKGEDMDFPGVADGVRGMAFLETVVESAGSEKKWVRMK